MSVEERLRRDAEGVARQVGGMDDDALLARISAALAAAGHGGDMGDAAGEGADTAWGGAGCLSPASGRMPPFAELKYHLGHALHSAQCARRAAELFELLGHDEAAVTCWRYAAEAGDPDAEAYVSEFIDPVPAQDPAENTRRFAELAHSFQ